jgi:hypothetical protein
MSSYFYSGLQATQQLRLDNKRMQIVGLVFVSLVMMTFSARSAWKEKHFRDAVYDKMGQFFVNFLTILVLVAFIGIVFFRAGVTLENITFAVKAVVAMAVTYTAVNTVAAAATTATDVATAVHVSGTTAMAIATSVYASSIYVGMLIMFMLAMLDFYYAGFIQDMARKGGRTLMAASKRRIR